MEHVGICAACFEPIKALELFRFRKRGRKFHIRCAKNLGNYYVRLEMWLDRKEGSDATNSSVPGKEARIPGLPGRSEIE